MIRTAPDGLRVVLANPNWLFGRGHMKEEQCLGIRLQALLFIAPRIYIYIHICLFDILAIPF